MTESTRAALLNAAEAAFASDGIDHASLRSVMREAGANPASVHYHFGSRDALARAVLDRVLEPLQKRRLALLDEVVAAGEQDEPRRLLEALVRPDLEQAVALSLRNDRGHRLIGIIYTQPSTFVTELVEASFAPVARRFLPHLTAAVPQLGIDEITWRIRWCVFGVVGSRLCDDELDITSGRLEPELDRILTALVGSLTAPPAGGSS